MPLIGRFLGTSQLVSVSDVAVINAQSVTRIPVARETPPEDPQPLLITFTSVQGTTPAQPLALIEWGSGGVNHTLGPIFFYPGLVIPVHGSWVRVALLRSVASTATPYRGGAFLSYGTAVKPPVIQIATLGVLIAGATQNLVFGAFFGIGTFQNPNGCALYPGLRAFKVRVIEQGGPTAAIDVNLGNFVYFLPAGVDDSWHELGAGGGFVPSNPTITLTNNGPNDVAISVLGELSL